MKKFVFFGAWAGAFVIEAESYDKAESQAIKTELEKAENKIAELYYNGKAILPVYSRKEMDLIKHMEISSVCEYRGQTVRTRKVGEIYQFGIMGYPYCNRLEDAFLCVPYGSYWSEAGYKFITLDSTGSVKLHKTTPELKECPSGSVWESYDNLWITYSEQEFCNPSFHSIETMSSSFTLLLKDVDITRMTRLVGTHSIISKFQYGDLVFAKEGHNKGKYFVVTKMQCHNSGIAVLYHNNISLESDLILIASRQELQTKRQNSLEK